MRDYPVVESAPYCCVAASLEAIFKRHGYNNVDQYDIANQIGLYVLESDKDVLPSRLVNLKYTNDIEKVGLHLYNDTLTKLFLSFNLPFKESYVNWSDLSEFNIDDIFLSIEEDDDALMLFDFGCLYKESKNIGVGHSGLFVTLDKFDIVTYMSPGPRFLGKGQFSSEDFLIAIKSRKGGISIIKKTKLSS